MTTTAIDWSSKPEPWCWIGPQFRRQCEAIKAEPTYLVIVRHHGIESAAVLYDPKVVPDPHAKRVEPYGLIDAIRLDTRPDAADWIGRPVDELFARWCWLRAPLVRSEQPRRLVGADRVSP